MNVGKKNEPSYNPDMVYSQSIPLPIGYNTDLEKWNNYPVSINRVGKRWFIPRVVELESAVGDW